MNSMEYKAGDRVVVNYSYPPILDNNRSGVIIAVATDSSYMVSIDGYAYISKVYDELISFDEEYRNNRLTELLDSD